MPVILDVKDFDRWLDPAVQEPNKLTPLLVPCREDVLTAYPVSTRVNNPRNDDARCAEPIEVGGQADIFG
jgi:putative SOS response-associated peptidase YedK